MKYKNTNNIDDMLGFENIFWKYKRYFIWKNIWFYFVYILYV